MNNHAQQPTSVATAIELFSTQPFLQTIHIALKIHGCAMELLIVTMVLMKQIAFVPRNNFNAILVDVVRIVTTILLIVYRIQRLKMAFLIAWGLLTKST